MKNQTKTLKRVDIKVKYPHGVMQYEVTILFTDGSMKVQSRWSEQGVRDIWNQLANQYGREAA